MHYCIIGSHINALHAAELALAAGHQVRLFHKGDASTEIVDPTHGVFQVQKRELFETVYGPVVDLADPEKAFFWNDAIHHGRIKKRHVLSHQEFGVSLLQDLLICRLRTQFSQFTGDAKEERSMSNWLERRLGGISAKHLYEPYAQKRWGREMEELSNTLARRHFYSDADLDYCALGGTAQSTYQNLHQKVSQRCELITELPTAIQEIGPQQWKVSTATQVFDHEGPLLVCLAPQQIEALFEVSKSVKVDLEALQFQDLNLASLVVEGHHNIHDLHVFSERLPFFRICFPYGQKEVAHIHLARVDVDDAEIRRGLQELGLGNIIENQEIRRFHLANWTPIWTKGCLARHRRVTRYFEDKGVSFFGRQGLFMDLNLSEDVTYLHAFFNTDNQSSAELQRVWLHPNPRTNDFNVQLGRIYR